MPDAPATSSTTPAGQPEDMRRRKDAIRAAALVRRDGLDAHERLAASNAIAEAAGAVFGEEGGLGEAGGKIVSGFWPIRSEIDPRPLMRKFEKAGARLALPCIEGGRMLFRRYGFGDRLRGMAFGLSEPMPGSEAVNPDLMLVPLAAFDRSGGRLGYGKGYYDSAIARLLDSGSQPCLLGLAFACQEVDAVPIEAHDRRLNAILTENGLVAARN